MLALRDQENLIHGHQAAAASKSLNQGVKQLPPKTPGNKAPKTPFKIPLNDENGLAALGGEKIGLKANGRGNENFLTGGKTRGLADKNAFITPLGPRNRAPLGLKTTNAKAKVFQTPAPLPLDNEVKKGDPKTGSARRAKPKASPAKMTKMGVGGGKSELGDEDIEYMPPPVKEMPDYPDDMPHDINLSMFDGGALKPGFLHHFITRVRDDGLTFHEREEREIQKANDLADKMNEALLLRDFESVTIPCVHLEDCKNECTASIENKKIAEEKYQKAMGTLSALPEQSNIVSKKPAQSNGLSTLTSKSAATALSQPKRSASGPPPRPSSKSSLISAKPNAILPRSKKIPQPTNPSIMRHNAASANSKTTIGHSKGRATSAALRKTALPFKNTTKPAEAPDTTLAPGLHIERYGVPKLGSAQWIRCKQAGYFDEEVELEDSFGGRNALDELLMEEAEREFQFDL